MKTFDITGVQTINGIHYLLTLRHGIAVHEMVISNQEFFLLLTTFMLRKSNSEFRSDMNKIITTYEPIQTPGIDDNTLMFTLKEMYDAKEAAFNESRLTHPMAGFKHENFQEYLEYEKSLYK